MLAVLAAAALARPGWGETEFLANLHKAETRKEARERIEYLDRAIQAWDGGAEQNELLASAYLMRGEARYWQNELAAADADLSKALELDARSAPAYLLRGRTRLRQSDFKGAERDLHEYTVDKPDDVEGWLALSDAQLRSGALQPALESLRKAEQTDGADWRVALGRARVAIARKNWRQALESLDTAGAAAKNQAPDVLGERAICRFAQGKPDDALRDYDAALPLFEKLLDRASHSKGRKIEAAEAQEKTARAYFGRGRVNEFLARIPEAGADYKEACRLGNQPACDKERALPAAVSAEPAKRPKDDDSRVEEPKPKKRKRVRVDSDSGDRIYAN